MDETIRENRRKKREERIKTRLEEYERGSYGVKEFNGWFIFGNERVLRSAISYIKVEGLSLEISGSFPVSYTFRFTNQKILRAFENSLVGACGIISVEAYERVLAGVAGVASVGGVA